MEVLDTQQKTLNFQATICEPNACNTLPKTNFPIIDLAMGKKIAFFVPVL